MKTLRFIASGLIAYAGCLGCSEPPAPTTTASTVEKPAAQPPTKTKGGRRARPPKQAIGSDSSLKAQTKPSTGVRSDL